MAWAFVQDLTEIGLNEYDRIAEAVGEDPPEGLILHVAGSYGGGVRIVDIWESEDDWNHFREGRLRTAIEGVMGPGAMSEGPPPDLQTMEVHHLIRGGSR